MPRAAKAAKRAPRKAAKRAAAKRSPKRAKAAKRAARPLRKAKRRRAPAVRKAAKPVAIGLVSHYFTNIKVAVVELTAPLKVGDRIRIVGATTNIEQRVASIHIEHASVPQAKAGDAIGLKAADRCRNGDTVYRL